MHRVLSLSLVALALALFIGAPVRADDKKADQQNPAAADKDSHTGKFLSAEGNRFTMTGKDGASHQHTLAPNAQVSCDGKECKLADLKPGTMIRVTTEKDHKDVATRVDARTQGFDQNKR